LVVRTIATQSLCTAWPDSDARPLWSPSLSLSAAASNRSTRYDSARPPPSHTPVHLFGCAIGALNLCSAVLLLCCAVVVMCVQITYIRKKRKGAFNSKQLDWLEHYTKQTGGQDNCAVM
jgi:hypothetical protein